MPAISTFPPLKMCTQDPLLTASRLNHFSGCTVPALLKQQDFCGLDKAMALLRPPHQPAFISRLRGNLDRHGGPGARSDHHEHFGAHEIRRNWSASS